MDNGQWGERSGVHSLHGSRHGQELFFACVRDTFMLHWWHGATPYADVAEIQSDKWFMARHLSEFSATDAIYQGVSLFEPG